MSKIAVIYAGKYGSTEKYAGWIAEDTGADIFSASKCKVADVMDYDTIVFGGAIHAGGIMGFDFIKKNIGKLSEKKLLVFAVGLNVDDEEARKECVELNFFRQPFAISRITGVAKRKLSENEERLSRIPCYFLKGAYDPAKVSGMDKQMMGVVKKMISGKPSLEITESEQELLKAIENGADYTDRAEILPIVEAVK